MYKCGLIADTRHKTNSPNDSLLIIWRVLVVPGAGVEPAHPFGHWCLRPTRLPIPPSGHCGSCDGKGITICVNMQYYRLFCFFRSDYEAWRRFGLFSYICALILRGAGEWQYCSLARVVLCNIVLCVYFYFVCLELRTLRGNLRFFLFCI